VAPQHILDIGCGTGRILIPLAAEGHRIVGVDNFTTRLTMYAIGLTFSKSSIERGKFSKLTLSQGDDISGKMNLNLCLSWWDLMTGTYTVVLILTLYLKKVKKWCGLFVKKLRNESG
jgi:SAM-dependent methyltransferase